MKIGVGLSGGVDSATSALILKEQGHQVKGYTMFLFDEQTEEIDSAKRTAEEIGIEHEIIDLRDEFKKEVTDKFLESYRNGLTPNPCLFCNKTLKYGKLLDYARKDGMDRFAMGHYAVKTFDEETGEYKIFKAKDRRKDQTYNLFRLNQKDLEFLYFPAGEFGSKADLRKKALSSKLNIADKKDSTGICFLGNRTMKQYLKEFSEDLNRPGNIVDTEDCYLGRHSGIYNYTLGQKKRLPFDNIKFEKPVVVKIDAENNKIVVGTEDMLYFSTVRFEDSNYLSDSPSFPMKVKAKLSQWSVEYDGTIYIDGTVEFDSPVRAPAPGQGIVFYDRKTDELLGGGVIKDM